MSYYQKPGSNLRSIHPQTMQVSLGLCFLHIIMEEGKEKQRLLKMCKRQTRIFHFIPIWQFSPFITRPDDHRLILRWEAWDPQLITEAAGKQSWWAFMKEQTSEEDSPVRPGISEEKPHYN